MENFKLVMPGDLNHYGYLFGGTLLKWVDEVSYIAASRDFPGCSFVTIGLDRVEFRRTVTQGAVLRFDARRRRVGNTSVQYGVDVYREDLSTGREEQIFTTGITLVRIDEDGRKTPLAAGEGGAGNPPREKA